MSDRSSHPHFDDRGTLHWHTRFADALAAARAGNKKLFIEFGRELCGQCLSLVEGVVPRPDVAKLLKEHFVALAADADDAEAEVNELADNLQGAMMLPFVIFADSSGRYLDGYSGVVTAPFLLRKLNELVSATANE
jgi:thioredoxin-related protein